MSDFEEEFPSIQFVFQQPLPDDELAAKSVTLMNGLWKEIVQAHCLDKQRVREAIRGLISEIEQHEATEINTWRQTTLMELELRLGL